MKKIILENVRILVIAGILSLGVSVAFAWNSPTTPPPSGTGSINVPSPINESLSGQTKRGNLIVANEGNFANGLIVATGNVGIGTGSVIPRAKLEVNGGVKVANDTSECNASKAGTIRYSSGIPKGSFEGCNGTNWISITSI